FGIPKTFHAHDVRKRARKIGKVDSIVMNEESSLQNMAVIVFSNAEEAQAARASLNNRQWNNKSVFARQPYQIASNTLTKAKCRLILRNLNFRVKEQDIYDVFSKHGPILEVSIARFEENTEKQGKSKGFAFVQFGSKVDATKALEGENGKQIGGREIAVDW